MCTDKTDQWANGQEEADETDDVSGNQESTSSAVSSDHQSHFRQANKVAEDVRNRGRKQAACLDKVEGDDPAEQRRVAELADDLNCRMYHQVVEMCCAEEQRGD